MPGGASSLLDLLKVGVRLGIFPGAVLRVQRGGEAIAFYAVGNAQVVPERRPMRLNSIFDLASVTKPVATATSVLILKDRGELRLDDRISQYIWEFAGNEKEKVTIRQLLSHTSGLPSHRPFYKTCKDKEEVLKEICATPLEGSPGEKTIYSDLGYMLLGELVERVSGKPLDVFAKENIFQPLGMKDTQFKPEAGRLRNRLVATENCPWRRRVILGEVHDENAYACGGVAGHAGLFSTAKDLTIYLQRLISQAKGILKKETVAEMTKPAVFSSEGVYGLGWFISLPSALLSEGFFSHGGFTGTYVAVDPRERLSIVFLTNRIHPKRDTWGFGYFKMLLVEAIAKGVKESKR